MFKVLADINEPIFYVTNDVARGIGLERLLPDYHLVCLDDHPLVDILSSQGVSVFCLERALEKKNALFRSSSTVLSHPLTLSFIKQKSQGRPPRILFFKPQKKLEVLAQKQGFKLLGNGIEINRRFEDKVLFFELCQREKIPVPEGEVLALAQADFKTLADRYGPKLVVQFGRGWAGNSTFFVRNQKELEKLKKEYGKLKVRICRLVEGKTILNNGVVFGAQVLIGPPGLQIKAQPPLAPHPGATAGRQWPANLDEEQKQKIKTISQQVGNLMAQKGYQGFFGLDFLIEEKTQEIFLSENNARLTASVPFYTKLELKAGAFPLLGYHLLAFENKGEKSERVNYSLDSLSGSEIVIRNCRSKPVRVKQALPTGIYRLPLEFKKSAYFLDTQAKDEFWLQTAAVSRVVNPEIELAKINTHSLVCQENGELKKEYQFLAEKILAEIKLEECKS